MADYQWNPLTDEKKFEDLVNDLCSEKYGLEFQIYGRKGQKQYGIDGSALTKDKRHILHQCKNKMISRNDSAIQSELLRDLENETESMVKEFIEKKAYILDRFIFAHSFKRDTKLQDKADELSKQYSISIIIWSWNEISDMLEEYDVISKKYYEKFFKEEDGKKIDTNTYIKRIDNNGGVINIYSSDTTQNLTEEELKAQREKEKKSLFPPTKESNEIYINRTIDNILSNEIYQKNSSILFVHAQGGSGKSTLLRKFRETNRPTIFIDINEQIDISAVELFLDDSKTTVCNCPKFEAKLDEIVQKRENNQETPLGEYALLEALSEDFSEHGLFIVDTFEKNKNSKIVSRVKFKDKLKFARIETYYRFRDYLEQLVNLFLHKTTFIIAGRNRISDVNEDRSQDRFLNLDEVQELTIEEFSILDIKQYIQESKLEQPTDKQLSQVKKLTNGNALLIYLLIKVASDYKSWSEFDYDEMKKVLLEDKDHGLIYYFTKRILTHIEIVDIWKLLIPRDLNLKVEPILFEDKGVFDSLVDVGLAYRGKGKERYSYTLHDDVYNAIEAHARKELKQDNYSWHDNKHVQNIHQQLKEFYEKDELHHKFDSCYHNIMMREKFESISNIDRKVFIQSFLGAIFTSYKEKLSFCKEFNLFDENRIKQTILRIVEEEIKQNSMSKELYQECSDYVSKGTSEDGVYKVDFLQPLLKKYKKQKDLLTIYSFLGQTYQNNKEYDKAREVYIEAVKRDLEDEDFFYLLIGNTYYYENNNEKALLNYKLASKINPKRDEVLNNIGAICYRIGEYDTAFEFYNKSIELNPTDGKYMNMAIIFYQKKKYDIAIKLYHDAIKFNPYNEWIYINMANCYRDKRPPHYKEALDIYEEARKINSNNEDIYNNLGILYFRKQKYEDAISFYQKAIEINSKNEWFYRNIGEVYHKLKNADKAVKYYKKAIEINPNESTFYNDIGLLLFSKKSYNDAISFFKEAIKIDSNSFIVYNNLGDAYEKNKEYDSAIDCYTKSLKIKKNYLAQFNGAKVYMKKKDYLSAIKIYQQLVDTYPRHKISIYRELYISYFYNRDYLMMLKTRKELFILEQRRKNYFLQKKREQDRKKFIEWKNNISISEDSIYKILIGIIASGCLGLLYILFS